MLIGVLLGTIIVLSSSSWILIWLGLELNLISFLPFINLNRNQKKNRIIYYLVQSYGSLLILFGGLLEENFLRFFWLVLVGMILKIGIIPFHFWVPTIIIDFNIFQCFVLLTWQKLAPLSILLIINFDSLIWTLVILNRVVGSIIVINSVDIRLVILFSSINHIRWLFSILSNVKLLWFYLIIYFILLIPIFINLNNFIINVEINKSLMLNILNLGGIPPLRGFFLKICALRVINIEYRFFLILGSSITLYAYSRTLLSSFYSTRKNKFEKEVFDSWFDENRIILFKENKNQLIIRTFSFLSCYIGIFVFILLKYYFSI